MGVTGHRDLVAADVPWIKELVREVLQTLKTKYPHTPLVLLSPLVERADELVEEVALELDIRGRLFALLCSPLDVSKHSAFTPTGSVGGSSARPTIRGFPSA